MNSPICLKFNLHWGHYAKWKNKDIDTELEREHSWKIFSGQAWKFEFQEFDIYVKSNVEIICL